jgi:hypothetical protein
VERVGKGRCLGMIDKKDLSEGAQLVAGIFIGLLFFGLFILGLGLLKTGVM